MRMAAACDLHQNVEARRVERGVACAHDAEKRFQRAVNGTGSGKTPVAKLWPPKSNDRGAARGLSASSRKRTMTAADIHL